MASIRSKWKGGYDNARKYSKAWESKFSWVTKALDVIVRLTDINNVNEYLLSFCQSNVSNQLLGSNACIIIAVLASINFLVLTEHSNLNSGFQFSWLLSPALY